MINGISSNTLASLQQSQQTALTRLSVGERLNSAKDDAAATAIASSFSVQIQGVEQANRNIYDGLSLANTASSGVSQISDTLQRARELAVQAGNGINSPSDSQALQGELSQLLQNVNAAAGNTQFNGQDLLQGGASVQIQSGSGSGDQQVLNLSGATTSALGINGLDVSNSANVSNVLQALDSALNNLSSQQAQIGATQSSLESALSANGNKAVATAEARSRVADTDVAQESSNLSRANINERVALQALSLYNANQPNPLSFVK